MVKMKSYEVHAMRLRGPQRAIRGGKPRRHIYDTMHNEIDHIPWPRWFADFARLALGQ